jgi:hypothetical protein
MKKLGGKKLVPKPRVLPAKVEVGPNSIPIIRKEFEDEAQMFGFYMPTNHGAVIAVDSRITGMRELAVFLHELVHAIDETAGLGLKHSQVAGLGEMLAQSLAPHFKF